MLNWKLMPMSEERAFTQWYWREGGRLVATLFGLAASVAFERQVVLGRMILPVLGAGAAPEPWMWASLFIPELVVCFLVGWQLRGWRAILVFAAAGAAVRQGTLALLHEVSSPMPEASARVLGAPAFAVAYLLALALASWSARTPGPRPAEPGAEG
ncbi:MAG: hypothetical protein QM767_00425 [Anaeromyxobacter sp.]